MTPEERLIDFRHRAEQAQKTLTSLESKRRVPSEIQYFTGKRDAYRLAAEALAEDLGVVGEHAGRVQHYRLKVKHA